MNDIRDIASAIRDATPIIGSEVISQANVLPSNSASTTEMSDVFNGGAGLVASIFSEVNILTTGVSSTIEGAIGNATSIVSMVVGGVTSSGIIHTGFGASATSSSSTSSVPQGLLPQSHGLTPPMNSKSELLNTCERLLTI